MPGVGEQAPDSSPGDTDGKEPSPSDNDGEPDLGKRAGTVPEYAALDAIGEPP
jgi:hypothetical protein